MTTASTPTVRGLTTSTSATLMNHVVVTVLPFERTAHVSGVCNIMVGAVIIDTAAFCVRIVMDRILCLLIARLLKKFATFFP